MITIKQKCYKKMEAWGRKARKTEVGGLLIGYVKRGIIIIEDAIMLKQVVSMSGFAITNEAMMDFTKNADVKLLSKVLGWWHSHNTMSTFWSETDDVCFRNITELNNFCLGIVIAFNRGKMDMRCRLDIKDYNKRSISIDGIETEIQESFVKKLFTDDYITKEFDNNVIVDDDFWKPCPMCNGYGMIENNKSKKGKKLSPGVTMFDEDDDIEVGEVYTKEMRQLYG